MNFSMQKIIHRKFLCFFLCKKRNSMQIFSMQIPRVPCEKEPKKRAVTKETTKRKAKNKRFHINTKFFFHILINVSGD